MTEPTLHPCPFCGGAAYFTISDDEGNLRNEEYEEDPWSGLSYMLGHSLEENPSCPIANYYSDGGQVGIVLYDSREDAAAAWNRRSTGTETV